MPFFDTHISPVEASQHAVQACDDITNEDSENDNSDMENSSSADSDDSLEIQEFVENCIDYTD